MRSNEPNLPKTNARPHPGFVEPVRHIQTSRWQCFYTHLPPFGKQLAIADARAWL